MEKIGKSGHTDVLAVSFSVTDYIGHAFGPNSLEAEDNLLRLDRTLQELFRFIDQQIGLDNTLIVLTSDHGVCPAPELMAELGIAAERLDTPQIMVRVNAALQVKFNTDAKLVLAFKKPGIYLDLDAINALSLDIAEVEQALAVQIMQIPGFSLALTKTDILTGRVAPRDVAPTISAYLGISPPSGAVGNPLPGIGETSSRP
jgi:hypothetical protein